MLNLHVFGNLVCLEEIARKFRSCFAGDLCTWWSALYPFLDDKSATCFLLNCKKYIQNLQNQYISHRVGELEEAVSYGRIELVRFFELPGYNDDLVQIRKCWLPRMEFMTPKFCC